jgi:hypothetical protein
MIPAEFRPISGKITGIPAISMVRTSTVKKQTVIYRFAFGSNFGYFLKKHHIKNNKKSGSSR